MPAGGDSVAVFLERLTPEWKCDRGPGLWAVLLARRQGTAPKLAGLHVSVGGQWPRAMADQGDLTLTSLTETLGGQDLVLSLC